MNTYELIAHGQTSGWNPATNAVNAKNCYGMRPVEVAAQAGNIGEFVAIVEHPEFDPTGARPLFFAEVGRVSGGDGDGDARFARFKAAISGYTARFTSSLS
jgi:hypothetical protein